MYVEYTKKSWCEAIQKKSLFPKNRMGKIEDARDAGKSFFVCLYLCMYVYLHSQPFMLVCIIAA